jgi:outer membrane protein insertion porin family
MKKTFLLYICLFILSSVSAQAREMFEVTDISVRGLSRISAETVFSYLPVGIGDVMDEEKSRNTIRALFNTGFFQDIKLEEEGEILIITVIERPTISSVQFVGNVNLDDDSINMMLDKAGLVEGRMLSEPALENFVHSVNSYYVSQGRYGAKVESAVNPQDHNRVAIAIQIDEGRVARVREIQFQGNQTYEDSLLRKRSVFIGNSWTNLLFGRNKFSQQKLEVDLDGWRNFYLDRGFLESEILSNEVTVNPDKVEIVLTISISEGPRYRVGRISVDESESLSAPEALDLLEIEEGMILSRKLIIRSRAAIQRKLGNAGHAFASVDFVPDLDRKNNIANITFVIDPGPQVYVRRINISGNIATQDIVIRREMRQMEGALYSGWKIQRSHDRIHRLGFFQNVSIQVVPVPGTADEVDLDVDVTERKTGNLLLGIGYADDEHGFVQAQVNRKNLFGSGRSLEISLDRSRIKQIYRLEYVNPYYTASGISRGIFARKNSIDASVGATAGYISNSTALGLSYRIPTSEYNALDLSGAYESVELVGVDSTPIEYRSFIDKHSTSEGIVITTEFSRDTRDQILFPQKGYLRTVIAETSIPASDLEYYKVSVRGQWYRSLSSNLVLGLSGLIGYGNGYGSTAQLPFYKNFFAGGVSSVRGYASGSLGPITAMQSNSDRLGGSRQVIANANLYFPVPGLEDGDDTRLSLFMDLGQVYGDSESVSLSDLRASTGVAFNWVTAIGPLALSYGVPLNAKSQDRTKKFQITLGTLFR